MKDTIYRADAIESVIAQRHRAELSDYNFALGLAEDAIRHLPSAEAKGANLINRHDATTVIREECWKCNRLINADLLGRILALPTSRQTDCTEFIEWLIEIILDDEDWELNAVGYGEIIARKMAKLGLLEVLDGYYIRTPNKPQNVVAEIKIDADEIVSKAISALSAVQGWIPCSERLPKEEKETYWVCTDTEYQCECRWTNNRFGIGEGEWGWSIFDTPQYSKPIAWMPLPKPYTKGDNDEER